MTALAVDLQRRRNTAMAERCLVRSLWRPDFQLADLEKFNRLQWDSEPETIAGDRIPARSQAATGWGAKRWLGVTGSPDHLETGRPHPIVR